MCGYGAMRFLSVDSVRFHFADVCAPVTLRFLSADSICTYSPVSADISSHFANEHPSRRFAVLELINCVFTPLGGVLSGTSGYPS